MIRTHVAKGEPVVTIEPRQQAAEATYKPKGLWYEVDGDWRRWCETEMPHWIEGRPVQQLHLDGERVLFLTTASEVDAFTRQYQAPIGGYQPDPRLGLHFDAIRWDRVAEEYDGIEIAPYQWSRRLDLMWYYGWDCASGCLWRPKGAYLDPPEGESDPLVPTRNEASA